MTNGFERYTKKTRRALFLEQMEQVVPWQEIVRADRVALSAEPVMDDRRWEWSGCCGCTFCSSGSISPIPQ